MSGWLLGLTNKRYTYKAQQVP